MLSPGEWEAGAQDPVLFSELGEGGEEVVRLRCHSEAISCTMNRSTAEQAFRTSNKCPCCRQLYPLLPGPQPTGVMRAQTDPSRDCEGHAAGRGSIAVSYEFEGGQQLEQHPEPGKGYRGTRRSVYLPNDDAGRKALELLKLAFERGVLFGVGMSVTTGTQEHCVVWNGIHQKTRRDGGAASHGYPDPTFLQRLESECALQGVDLQSKPPQSSPPGTVRLDIEVPEGANVGDRLTFNTAAGQFSLVVPPGAAPGKKMMVTMPVPANFQSNQQLAISSLRINGNAVVPASARQQSIGGGVPQNSSISGTALQNATDQARSQRQRQVEASIASARQGLACINADHARFMCMDINANPVLARKRDEKVAELLARRAQVEDLVAQLLKKLDNDEPPPGWTAEQRETSTGRKYKVPAVSS